MAPYRSRIIIYTHEAARGPEPFPESETRLFSGLRRHFRVGRGRALPAPAAWRLRREPLRIMAPCSFSLIDSSPDYMSQGFVIRPALSVGADPFHWRKTIPFNQIGK